MFTIEQMIKTAQKEGYASEGTMWASVKYLEKIKEENKQLYWKMAREMHNMIYNGHYSEDFALYDVSQIFYLDKNDNKIYGPHWTVSDIEEATKSVTFPKGTNKWDKYVAYNVLWIDLQSAQSDEEILRAVPAFFFKDVDYTMGENTTKLWTYMNCRCL